MVPVSVPFNAIEIDTFESNRHKYIFSYDKISTFTYLETLYIRIRKKVIMI